jgi:hypothetical protein
MRLTHCAIWAMFRKNKLVFNVILALSSPTSLPQGWPRVITALGFPADGTIGGTTPLSAPLTYHVTLS